jgi:hypothetical protein
VSEGLQTNKRARIHCQKPGIKVLSRPRAHHLNKLLHEEIGLVNLWIKLSQLAHGLLFFRSKGSSANKMIRILEV